MLDASVANQGWPEGLGRRAARGGARALGAVLLVALLPACVPAHRRASWRLYPLQRSQPHDGLAVVSEPDGYGLHIWLETDTHEPGVCTPRWLPDPARLFNGNGRHPFSSGLASRQEFFDAVGRRDVRRQLRRELEALCRLRAPRSSWRWQEPPRSPQQIKVVRYPMLEQPELLPDAAEVREQEQQLLQQPPTSP